MLLWPASLKTKNLPMFTFADVCDGFSVFVYIHEKINFKYLYEIEVLYLLKFVFLDQFRTGLDDYLDYYNNQRIMLKLNGLTPAKHRSQAISFA